MSSGFSRVELLRRLATAVRGKNITYAVGGASALKVHGYSRSTQDVDVFVVERHLPKLLRALRVVGLDVFAIYEPSHYAAKLPGDPNPERRIDVLVPYSEPELSAVEFPSKKKLAVEFPSKKKLRKYLKVFDVDLLALTKFYALEDSRDPRHGYDLLAMHRRGMFSVRKVRLMLTSVDPARLKSFDELIRTFDAPTQSRKERPEGRIRRGES